MTTIKSKQFQYTEDGHLILMTPDERNLLITDLIARINYGVICMIKRVDDFGPVIRNEKLTGFYYRNDKRRFSFDFSCGLSVGFAEKVKPYLRSLSSMTKDEERELRILWNEDFVSKESLYHCYPRTLEFYLSHHFDYRGLIEMGLAIEVTKENNPYA